MKKRARGTAVLSTLLLFGALSTGASAAGLGDLFGDARIVDAARKGSVAETKAEIVAGESVHKRAADGTPLIVLATASRNLDLVTLLIENGARPDDRSRDETTALTLAAANGDADIVAYLLEQGADIDKTGSLRETALIKAVRGRHLNVVRVLVEKGADLEETDPTGATPLDIAERNNQADIAALLKKASQK